MEPDRVEMSVGGGMVNGDHFVNGTVANGSSANPKSQAATPVVSQPNKGDATSYTNGESASSRDEHNTTLQPVGSILHDAPPELVHALSSEFYLPMATLISRSAQSCWNDLFRLVEKLASMPVSSQSASNGVISVNDQSKVNLEKKDLLLNFAKEHKDIFIKLLVLLQWSKRSEDVRQTIELNLWLQQRRQAFNNATGMLGAMIQGLAEAQVPNPDLYTAGEVLATGNVSSMPKLDYIPQSPQSTKQIMRLLGRLDTLLCARMTLEDEIPSQLENFHVHDGRVTFAVENEFTFDVSIASEEPDAKFGMVDFNFLFSPAPSIPDGLHDEVTYIANTALDKDGFAGVYDFLHNLTLSYKLNELAKQARKLAQGLWSGHIRVELLRRTLVVQYWLKSSLPKSWIEIGVHSGRSSTLHSASAGASDVRLRWLSEGKLADSTGIDLDMSHLSFENILRQVIARHTNSIFDAIYDKLATSILYSSAELELNQSASSEDPAECMLEVQLSKSNALEISMEPIGGSFVLSPVSERMHRLQLDLGRTKNLVDDTVHRIIQERFITAESNLMKALPNSPWQCLENVKFNTTEAERVFGHPVAKVSFIRLEEWAQEWMLAITQSTTGDLWWLTQTAQPNHIRGGRTTKIVDNRPLYMTGSLSPAYLERLADYTTGVIALQCNAQFLNRRKLAWRLPDLPPFDIESRLPALQFNREPGSSQLGFTNELGRLASKPTKRRAHAASFVHLTYHGMTKASKKVIMIAKTALVADQSVLEDLVSSQLDKSVAIIPKKQQLMIKIETDVGTPVVDALVSKLSHLENVVAYATAVKRSSEHILQSLALSSMTILYHQNPDLGLSIDFDQRSYDVSASFSPAGTNPHQHLSHWVGKTMRRKGPSSSSNLSIIFVVLRITLPILSYLQTIQSPRNLNDSTTSDNDNHLRVHLLHRQPTAYALHYFADSSNFNRDDNSLGTPQRLLARFEVLAMRRGDKLIWMVRPAIEEFNSYNRPSYTSNTLREKLDQEIFRKQNSSWLALDGGAACPSDKPEQLLAAIHATIIQWAKESIKPSKGAEADTTNSHAPSVNTNNEKPVAKPVPLPHKQQNTQRPNAVQRPQQPNNQQRPQSFNNRSQNSRPSEVITLD